MGRQAELMILLEMVKVIGIVSEGIHSSKINVSLLFNLISILASKIKFCFPLLLNLTLFYF